MPNRNSLYYTKMLVNGTTCENTGPFRIRVGHWVNAEGKDENGLPIHIRGYVEEVFESERYPSF